jgi:uncharacterized protein DUF4244
MARTAPVEDGESAVPDGGTGRAEPVVAPAGPRSLVRALARRWAAGNSGEAGMSTAEYAVGTVAACAFAAVLYKVVTGGSVVAALGELVQSALSTLS